PEPVGLLNVPQLLHLGPSDKPGRRQLRYAANNYYLAHARNLFLMAAAFDPADDPGGTLRAYISNVTGAWLYVIDYLLRNDMSGGSSAEGCYYGIPALGRLAQLHLALRTSGVDDSAISDHPFFEKVVPAYLHSLSPGPVEHPQLGPVFQAESSGD